VRAAKALATPILGLESRGKVVTDTWLSKHRNVPPIPRMDLE
jgi:hypothetical protein